MDLSHRPLPYQGRLAQGSDMRVCSSEGWQVGTRVPSSSAWFGRLLDQVLTTAASPDRGHASVSVVPKQSPTRKRMTSGDLQGHWLAESDYHPDLLFHYATNQKLVQVLGSEELWLAPYAWMNDPREQMEWASEGTFPAGGEVRPVDVRHTRLCGHNPLPIQESSAQRRRVAASRERIHDRLGHGEGSPGVPVQPEANHDDSKQRPLGSSCFRGVPCRGGLAEGQPCGQPSKVARQTTRAKGVGRRHRL